jgi:hypothetical protein
LSKERIWEEYPKDAPAGNLTTLLEQLDIDPNFALSREKFSDRPLDGTFENAKKALRAQAGAPEGNLHNPAGNNQYKRVDNSDNYQNCPPEETKLPKTLGEIGGTSKDYTLARLERDNAALYERVSRGELSANAAAIEAGWRKPQARYSLPDDPQAAGRYLAQRVDRE